MSNEVAIYEGIRSKIATMLGLDVAALTASQSIRLDVATCLQCEIDRIQESQLAGEPIDIGRLANASSQLVQMLPEDDPSRFDLSRLSDEELSVFETLIAKATGVAPPIEPPEDRQADPRADLLARMSAEVDELRRANTTLTVQLETAESRLRHVEARKAAEEVDAAPPPGPRIVVDNGSPYWR
jgi:hypothetical protein